MVAVAGGQNHHILIFAGGAVWLCAFVGHSPFFAGVLFGKILLWGISHGFPRPYGNLVACETIILLVPFEATDEIDLLGRTVH
ncbi:MAG: hypothetical protein AB3N28_06370 [Kordiimonas sp.]